MSPTSILSAPAVMTAMRVNGYMHVGGAGRSVPALPAHLQVLARRREPSARACRWRAAHSPHEDSQIQRSLWLWQGRLYPLQNERLEHTCFVRVCPRLETNVVGDARHVLALGAIQCVADKSLNAGVFACSWQGAPFGMVDTGSDADSTSQSCSPGCPAVIRTPGGMLVDTAPPGDVGRGSCSSGLPSSPLMLSGLPLPPSGSAFKSPVTKNDAPSCKPARYPPRLSYNRTHLVLGMKTGASCGKVCSQLCACVAAT